jgi:type IX secretion system PorP/SprF family membrane protein
MGISGIICRNLYDYSNTHPIDASDPSLQNVTEHKLTTDANAGLVFYKKNWYAGISVLEFFKSEYFLNSTNKNKFDYYILAGYYLNLNRKIRFEPLLVCKKINSEKINFDIHTNFSYDKIYSIGVSWHTRQYIAYNVNFRIYKHLYAGYAFHQQINDLAGSSLGSHIINLYFLTNSAQ